MATEIRVRLTSHCAPFAGDGQILLPRGSVAPKGRRILVAGGGISRLMKVGSRSDGGDAACVSGGALAAFGGEGAEVSYRGVSFLGVLLRDPWLLAQFATSLLTLVATGITAYLTFIRNSGEDAGAFANQTAFWALAVAAMVAILKFLKEYREL